MRRSLLAAALLAAPAMPISSALAAEVQLQASGPVVELQVTETVMGDPDEATIGAGVTTRAATATAAMQQNAREMDRVIKRLEALGIDRSDIQTSGINLNPQYNYRNNQPPQFIGYDAMNTVNVRLDDVERVGTVLDALVEAGATNLSGPFFTLSDPEPARDQARKAAFARARQQALDYAKMAGFAGLRLLSVEEAMAMGRPYMMEQSAVRATVANGPDTPVRPGQVGTQVTITARYEMTR